MKSKHKTLKMEPDLLSRIEQWCVKEDRSFNWFISKAAEEKVERDAQTTPILYARAGARAAESGERKCKDRKHCGPQKAVNS